jgi:hypothetical protein
MDNVQGRQRKKSSSSSSVEEKCGVSADNRKLVNPMVQYRGNLKKYKVCCGVLNY